MVTDLAKIDGEYSYLFIDYEQFISQGADLVVDGSESINKNIEIIGRFI
ncbi:hypothetical protein [Enterococcus rivorum]|nr:hypothetical protein [Enterococcus rivorum]MBP2099821.1 hypothetical protein [Enterococcus rivorum]